MSNDRQFIEGNRYFFRKAKRTDQFAHKRYTDPTVEKWADIVIMGKVVAQRGAEVKVVVEESQLQRPEPVNGDFLVFDVGCALTVTGGAYRVFEQHGKPDIQLGVWVESDFVNPKVLDGETVVCSCGKTTTVRYDEKMMCGDGKLGRCVAADPAWKWRSVTQSAADLLPVGWYCGDPTHATRFN